MIGWLEAPRGKLAWEHSEQAARARAESERRPMLVDFTATWCGACNELSRITFADPAVMSEAGRFVAVKVDASNEDDPSLEQIKDRYHVVATPALCLLAAGALRSPRRPFEPSGEDREQPVATGPSGSPALL